MPRMNFHLEIHMFFHPCFIGLHNIPINQASKQSQTKILLLLFDNFKPKKNILNLVFQSIKEKPYCNDHHIIVIKFFLLEKIIMSLDNRVIHGATPWCKHYSFPFVFEKHVNELSFGPLGYNGASQIVQLCDQGGGKSANLNTSLRPNGFLVLEFPQPLAWMKQQYVECYPPPPPHKRQRKEKGHWHT